MTIDSGIHHNFDRLEINDLLEAREAYHLHLLHLPNVVATAIGRYLIRKTDSDFNDPDAESSKASAAKRTLENSAVRPWSRPCVLVFVKEWPDDMQALRREPENFVPNRLYLPDDRVVPTCVVCATSAPTKSTPISDDDLNKDILGGGYPVLSDVQGQKRVGSVGCLVTDGHSVFALTNRHVAGPEGQESYMTFGGERHRVGKSVEPSVRTIRFKRAYPGWPGARSHVNLDAGLIRVDRIDDWTAQVYGLGVMGELQDFYANTLTLDRIDQGVKAFGGISGPLSGRILGLFYRYRSRAGLDFVSDFLIGPAEGETTVPTRHGDSGTLWFFEKEADGKPESKPNQVTSKKDITYSPFSIQWGATALRDDADQERMQFALTSNLSTVLRELDVEIIRDWNVGLPETWGKMGHYHIAAKACDVVSDAKLFKLLQANRDLIGLSDADRRNKSFPVGNDPFIPLADVPDLWWKKRGVARPHEKPTHFADMDEVGKGAFSGLTLLDLYDDDADSLNTADWIAFYESIDITPRNQGSLPFRISQFYEEMVGFVRDRKLAHFVAAAGILAHYVGDAAQPLHGSHLHHGATDEEEGVHAQFETGMLNKFNDELMDAVDDALDGSVIAGTFQGAQTAAEVSVDLMAFVQSHLPPRTIIDEYLAAKQTVNTNDALWEAVGDRTTDCVVEGILYLAEIWESAWIEGGGHNIGMTHMKRQTKARLRRLYKRKTFIKSKFLNEY